MWQLAAMWLAAQTFSASVVDFTYTTPVPYTALFRVSNGARTLCSMDIDGKVSCEKGVTAEEVFKIVACSFDTVRQHTRACQP